MADVIVPVKHEEQPITPAVLRGWLRRAKRKFRNGVIVLKVTSMGKLARRSVFVGAREEYFEITSAKLFDLGYHMSDIDEIKTGCDSPDFESYKSQNPERMPNELKSCVVKVKTRPISLVFKTEADRRDFIFLMRVEMKTLEAKQAAQ